MSGVHSDPEFLLAQSEWLRRIARELVGDEHLAEDLSQEASIAALAGAPGAEPDRRRWLHAVVRRQSAGRFRAEARRAQRERQAARPELQESAADTVERFALQRSVADAVLSLDEPMRSTVLLRFWEGLPPRKVSQRMGVPVETVRTRLRRALERLRAQLDREHGGDRRAWALPLAAAFPYRAGWLAGIGLGLWVMGNKQVFVAAAAALLLLSSLVLLWPGAEPALPGAVPEVAAQSSAVGSLGEELPDSAAVTAPIASDAIAPRAEPPPPPPLLGFVSDHNGIAIRDAEIAWVEPTEFQILGLPAFSDHEGAALASQRARGFLGRLAHRQIVDGEDVILHPIEDLLGADRVVRSDVRGAFAIPLLRGGDTSLLVAWSRWHGVAFLDVSASWREPHLVVHGHRVHGQVRLEDGRPVADAEVWIHYREGEKAFRVIRSEADPLGAFRSLPLPPGGYRLDCKAPGYQLIQPGEWFDLGEDRAHDLVLEPVDQYRVTLTDLVGVPWTENHLYRLGWQPGALQWFLCSRRVENRTAREVLQTSAVRLNRDGVLGGSVEDESRLYLSAWYKSQLVGEAQLPGPDCEKLAIELAEPRPKVVLPVHVELLEAEEGDAEVEAETISPRTPLPMVEVAVGVGDPPWLRSRGAVRGPTGSLLVELEGDLRGETVYLIGRARGYEERIEPMALPRNRSQPSARIRLRPARHGIEGRVVDSLGNGIAGARVLQALPDGRPLRAFARARARSDARGHFHIPGLGKDPVRLICEREGFACASVLVDPRRTKPTVVTLTEGREIRMDRAADGPTQLRVLGPRREVLWDDRLAGQVRFGLYGLTVPENARSVEWYEPGNPRRIGRGRIRGNGAIRLR